MTLSLRGMGVHTTTRNRAHAITPATAHADPFLGCREGNQAQGQGGAAPAAPAHRIEPPAHTSQDAI